MNKFLHGNFYINHLVVLGVSLFLFVLGLVFRLYKLDQRIWFEADHTRDLLYAWNVVHTQKPLIIGLASSGTPLPNSPFYWNFLALLTWMSESNPITVVYLFTIITTMVVPLLFIWGVVEGSFLSGFIAAIVYAVFPGTVEFTNVWQPFLAIEISIFGIIFFRWASKHTHNVYRVIGLYLLCLAGITHFSFIGLLASIILYEFVRYRNVKQTLVDVGVSAVVLCLLLLPTYILMGKNILQHIAVTYSDGTCRFCLQKILLLFQSELSELFWPIWLQPFAQQLLCIVVGGISFVVIFVRRKLFTWGFYVSFLFVLFAWAFAGQIAFWYLSPLVIFAIYLFGDIIAKGLRDKHVYVQILSTTSLIIFIFLSLRSYGEFYYPTSMTQNVIGAEEAIRRSLLSIGIINNDYIEYAELHTSLDKFPPSTTAFWLVRQWKYHEIITYNDPQQSNDIPLLINPTPRYRVYVCGSSEHQLGVLAQWEQDGYVYKNNISLGNKLMMYIYKRKE